MSEEIWKDIDGYPDYQVSSCGRVKSFKYKTPRMLKPHVVGAGYLGVELFKNAQIKFSYIHRLVAQAFIPNPNNKPEINHINGVKDDNRVENLEWCTPKENKRHAVSTGLRASGADDSRAKLTNEQVRYIRDNPDGLLGKELARQFNVDENTISVVQMGMRYKNAGGQIRGKIDHRLPDEVRDEIRRLYVHGSHEFGSRALARRFGCSKTSILRIVNEK